MKYEIITEKNWHTVIDVFYPPDDIAPQIKKEFDDHQQTVKIQGFRKGKVPASLVQKMFGKQIESKVCAPYIREAWEQIFEENDFDFLTKPGLQDVRFDPEQGLTFKIKFEIQPKIVVQNFENMPVDREIYRVTETDVEAAIENVRQDQAMIYIIETSAQQDHILVADIQELDRTGVPIIGKKFDNYEIRLQGDDLELTSQLLGISVGEQRRITLKPQPPQQSPEILDQGKAKEEPPQSFAITVKEIKERRLPQLDDDFAKNVGPFQSLDDLKAKIENSLKTRAKIRSQYQFERALEDELIKRNDFKPPETMLNRYLDAIVKDVKSEQKNKKISEKEIKSAYQPIAVRNVKWIIIRQRLIEQMHLEVAEDEINRRIEELEKLPDADPQKINELRTNEEKHKNLENDILDAKIHSFLASQAKVNEINKSWSRLESAESTAENADIQ